MLIKRAFVGLLSIVLFLSLIGLAQSTSFNATFKEPKHIEKWVNQSSLYDDIINKTTDQVVNTIKVNYHIIGIDDPIKNAAESAYPKSSFQTDVNTFINGNYAWLKGQTSVPDFNLSFKEVKQNFASQIGIYAQKKLTNMPACTAAQTQKLLTSSSTILDCSPATLSPATINAQLADLIVASSAFSSKDVITANTFGAKVQSPNAYYNKLSVAPTAYRWNTKLPWIFGLISLLLITTITLVDRTKKQGLKKISFAFLLSGIALIIPTFVTKTINTNLINHIPSNTDITPYKSALSELLKNIDTYMAKIDMWLGVTFVIIGVLILLGLYILRKNQNNLKPNVTKTVDTPNKQASATSIDASNIRISNRRNQQPNQDIIGGPRKNMGAGTSRQPRVALKPKSGPPAPSRRLIQ